ncbi:hypothetical protein D3C85_1622030 [compost metagenome]
MVASPFEVHVRRHAQPLAAERRDAAIGIGALVGTDASQILAQALHIFRCGVRRTDCTASQ